MLIGGIHGKGHIDRRDRGNERRPQRSSGGRSAASAECESHQQPGEEADELRHSAGKQRKPDRGEISQCHAGDGGAKQQRRIIELRIGRARHHAADIGDRRISADAVHALGQRERDRAVAVEQFGQRAIVDQGAADRGDAARLLQRIAAHQHAAAGRGGGRAPRIIDPGEGIEHLEKEDEGRHEHALGKALAAQFRHQRGQYQAVRLRPRHEIGHCVLGTDDVGVGQQQVDRRRAGHGEGHALLQRPELAGPAGRQRSAREHGQPLAGPDQGRRAARHVRGGVSALIVDHDHAEFARIILPQQRGDGLADAFGLVARGNDRHHRGPHGERRDDLVIALGRPPEAAARGDEIEPDRQHY